MPDQPTGTPAPDNNPQGTVQQPQQPQVTPQNPADTQQPNQPAVTPPPAPQQPSVEELQARIANLETSNRHHQSRASQFQNQLQALTGAAPQRDPIAERAQRLIQAGMHADDAPVFARAFQSELAPLQQENQRLTAALQGQTMVDQIMQAAAQQAPGIFDNPTIAQQVYSNLRQVALSGDTEQLTPGYALAYADAVVGQMYRTGKLNQPAPQPQPFRPAGTMSFGGNGSNYAPNAQPHQQQQPEDPAVKAAADQMAMRWSGKPLSNQ